MKSRMLFRNELPYRARVEFCALESLVEALKGFVRTSEMLRAQARTEAEREEWEVVLTRAKDAFVDALSAIEATTREPLGFDTYDAVAKHIDFPCMYRVLGEADALGRLHVRTVGTPDCTGVAECVADIHQRLVRLGEAHAENHRSKRFCHQGFLGTWLYGVYFPNGSAQLVR